MSYLSDGTRHSAGYYHHSNSRTSACRHSERSIASLPAAASSSLANKLADDYCANLVYEQHCSRQGGAQHVHYGNEHDVSPPSCRQTSMNPALEDFDADDVSMPDSIRLHRHANKATSNGKSDYYGRASSSAISEKLVQFAEDALAYSSDYTFEEVRRMWLNQNELAVFKQERKDMVKVLKKHNFNLSEVEKNYGRKYCLRGYEPYFSLEGNKEIRRSRVATLTTVMNEQKRQRATAGDVVVLMDATRTGQLFDHASIAKHSADASKWARDCARRLGEQDMNEVTKTYGLDVKARSPRDLWDYIIDQSIQEVIDLHEEEFLRDAMEYSKMEQQLLLEQEQYYGEYHQPQHEMHLQVNEARPRLDRSMSEELLCLQREQLLLLQEHQNKHQHRSNEPALYGQERELSRDEQMYQMQQDQLLELQREREMLAAHEQQQRNEDYRQRMLYEEQQTMQDYRSFHQHQDDHQRLQEDEHQQMLLVQKMEMEQQRQQEQLRLMMEEQRRLEAEHCSRNGGGGNDVDDELASALQLIELQYNSSRQGY